VRDGFADHWRESYVGETGKSMKAAELAMARYWRKNAIALIGRSWLRSSSGSNRWPLEKEFQTNEPYYNRSDEDQTPVFVVGQ